MKKYIVIAIIFLVFGCKTQKANLYNRIPNANDYRGILKDTIIDVQIKEMYEKKIKAKTHYRP